MNIWTVNAPPGIPASLTTQLIMQAYLDNTTLSRLVRVDKAHHTHATPLMKRLPQTSDTMKRLAGGGHLGTLQWLRAQDPPCPWDERKCEFAVEGCHLETLKWMRAQDPPAPWGETCEEAAAGNHLELLKWARAQDPPAPWDERTCEEAAAENGHTEILNWMGVSPPGII